MYYILRRKENILKLGELRKYCLTYFATDSQDMRNINGIINRVELDYDRDAEFQIAPVECAFCESEAIWIYPESDVFPIMCPGCNEKQLYIKGQFKKGLGN